jgi:hypothetical protein
MHTNLIFDKPLKVDSTWKYSDYWGSIKVRASIGRDNYKIQPGLYAFGKPVQESNVFVTANYKLSFDILRRSLAGLNAWILVLDTNGVNVWCAAGKGTFGTNELIRRIESTNLSEVVSHRRLILPQLGAPGVAAHKIKQNTGFTVKFGPVRASDIHSYLESGLKKTEQMRTVNFNLIDRIKVIPVEVAMSFIKFLGIGLLFIILSGISSGTFSLNIAMETGFKVFAILAIAYISGIIVSPVLLPLLPFRCFSAKGMVAGALMLIIAMIIFPLGDKYLIHISLFLTGISISSFLAMNFTGSSTYTSLSGVRKEMRYFLPIQIILASIGLILFIVSRFVNF